MTTPSDAFDYNDDSVVARVSFDIPSQALNDISQLTQAMGAMRTQLEAISRAQSDWLDYLNQVPQITEQANQALRDQLTLLERMSYVQNEIAPSAAGGGGGGTFVGGGGGQGGGGGGGYGGGYSTAAPMGYVNPFQGMTEGIGQNNPMAEAVNQQLAAIAENDPRLAANMGAARGMAVNPALLGMIGGAVAGAFGQDSGGGLGKGQPATGSKSKQPSTRRASGPPNAANKGAPVGSDPDDEPGPPSDDDPWWRHLSYGIMQEIRNSGGMDGGRIGDVLGKMLPGTVGSILGGLGMGGGAGSGGGTGGPPGGGGGGGAGAGGAGGGGWGSKIAKAAATQWKAIPTSGKVGLGLGAAAFAFNKVQDVGERITRLQELGSEEGGDWTTGLKEDLHSRIIAMDPYINTDQARKATQMVMSAGFQGDSRSELRDLLIANFKELGMTFAQTMSIEMANLRGQELTDENVKVSRTATEATVNVMKELAGKGGNSQALSERLDELEKMSVVLNSLGSSQGNVERTALGWQAAYGDSLALRGSGSQIVGQTMSSPALLSMAASKVGVTGYLPEALPAALEEAGYDDDEVTNMVAAEVAKRVSGIPKKLNRIAAFKNLMAQNGVQLDWQKAKDLYEANSGDKGSPTDKANKTIADQAKPNHQTNWNPISYINDIVSPIVGARNFEDLKDMPGDVWNAIRGFHPSSQNADNAAKSYREAGRLPGNFEPNGRKPRPLPENAAQIPASVNTQGKVTGTVTITVDQQGRVTAPASIQLTGQQKAALAGYGSSQLNNAPPGDPTYYHAYNAFPGGG